MKTQVKSDKIYEAIELLNEAAKDKKAELYELIDDKYSYIKEVLTEKAETGKEVVNQAKKQLLRTLVEEEEKIVKKAKDLDKKVRRNPWPLLGVVAFGSVLFGIIMGKK